MSIGEHRFVFVGGLHRSGTTPLARVLATHTEISALTGTGVPMDEGQHLQTVYPTARALGGPGLFGFASGAHLTECSSLTADSARTALLRAWTPFWDMSRPVLLEKSPPNLLRMRFLQALFPTASFVVVVRHPVASSLAAAKWSNASLERALAHWEHCHRLLLEDAPHVHALRIVRYEDLVAAPKAVLDQLATFLAVRSSADWRLIGPSENERYFRLWRAAPPAIELSDLPLAAAFGYRFDHLDQLEGVDTRVSRLPFVPSA